MIKTVGLSCEKEAHVLSDINLTVENGEIYLLLCSREKCIRAFSDMLGGYLDINDGKILVDGCDITAKRNKPVTVIHHYQDPLFFDLDLSLLDIVNFYCKIGKIDRQRLLEILLMFNIFERDLKLKVRDSEPTIYKIISLSLLLAKGYRNIVITDYIRGEDKELELSFNRLLLQLKKEGKAILYMTGDIFYAYRIADRVSFIKNGFLMPAEPIASKDLKELDAMAVYKKYLT
jgi:ABC-2 type transport system ATP-binding protein